LNSDHDCVVHRRLSRVGYVKTTVDIMFAEK